MTPLDPLGLRRKLKEDIERLRAELKELKGTRADLQRLIVETKSLNLTLMETNERLEKLNSFLEMMKPEEKGD